MTGQLPPATPPQFVKQGVPPIPLAIGLALWALGFFLIALGLR